MARYVTSCIETESNRFVMIVPVIDRVRKYYYFYI